MVVLLVTCEAGKTFERVCCNLGEGAVEQKWGHGLGFVALSRAMALRVGGLRWLEPLMFLSRGYEP
jgi:hypothetical protein